jgi:iron complex outermembrane receptor protein
VIQLQRILLVLLLVGGTTFLAHSQLYHGTLIDQETGTKVQGALVMAYPSQDSLTTDVLGGFTFSNTVVDSIVVKHPSYRTAYISAPKTMMSIYMKPDALTMLDDAIIAAKAADADTYRTPVSSATLKTPMLTADDQSSLSLALNSIPGVQFEQRGLGGSRRINIRSSMVRSPFAVRNFQLFLDQFSLTSPDGQVALELIDPYDLAQLTVVKGPFANKWGAGIGGALLAQSKRAPELSTVVHSGVTVGSYDFFRSTSGLSMTTGRFNIRVSHIHQETDGYRDQEYNKKRQLSMRVQYYPSNTLDYTLWSTLYEGKWGLPGGLSGDQVDFRREAAAQYAIDNFAHVHRRRFRTGVTQRWTQRYFQNQTTVYVNTTTKINPFGTNAFFNGYKDEAANGFGVRNQTDIALYKGEHSKLNVNLTLQYLNEANDLFEYDNAFGQPGTFRYENNTLSQEQLGSLELEYDLNERLLVNAGVTYVNRTIDSDNRRLTDQATEEFNSFDRSFEGFMPRVGISYLVNEHLAVVANASQSFSPPSLFELIQPQTGLIAPNLSQEIADSYEFGVKGQVFTSLSYDISVYQTEVRGAIREVSVSEFGPEVFTNVGDMTLQGIEARLLWNTDLGENVQLSLYANGALQDHSWRPSDLDPDRLPNDDFENREYELPGTPRATFASGADVRLKSGLFANVHWQWVDGTPANSVNTVMIAAYDVLNSKVGWDFSSLLNDRWEVSVFAGVQNAFDELYTSFVAFDAVGDRYYNPMPRRNYYGGIEARFRISK